MWGFLFLGPDLSFIIFLPVRVCFREFLIFRSGTCERLDAVCKMPSRTESERDRRWGPSILQLRPIPLIPLPVIAAEVSMSLSRKQLR